MLITLQGDHFRQHLYKLLQDAGGLAACIAPTALDPVVCFGDRPILETLPNLDAGQGWSQSSCLSEFKTFFEGPLGATLIPVFHDPWAELSDIANYPDPKRSAGAWFGFGGRPYRLPDPEDDFPIDKWFRGAVSWLQVVYFLERGPLPVAVSAGELNASHEISHELAKSLCDRIAWVFVTAFDHESWLGARLSPR